MVPEQTQLTKIRELMLDGEWRTYTEIEAMTGAAQNSISAQLRNLRKSEHGSWEMLSRVRLYTDLNEYQILASDHPQAEEIRRDREKRRQEIKVSKHDYRSWSEAVKELLLAVAAVNMEDAEGDTINADPAAEPNDPNGMQGPVAVRRAAMHEVLRLGWWLKAKASR